MEKKKMEIFFDQKEKIYRIFNSVICNSCGKEILNACFVKMVQNKIKYFCNNPKCINEYKNIISSGESNFPAFLSSADDCDISKLTIVTNTKFNSAYGKVSFSDSIKSSVNLVDEPSAVTIDNTKYSNINQLLDNPTKKLIENKDELLDDIKFNQIIRGTKNARKLVNN